MRFLYSQYAVFKELSLLASDWFQLLKNSFRLSYFSLKPFSGKEIWYQRTPCMSRNWKTFSKKASKQLSTSSWTFRLSQFLQVPLNLQPDTRSIHFHPIDFYRAVSCKRIPWSTAAVHLQSLKLAKQTKSRFWFSKKRQPDKAKLISRPSHKISPRFSSTCL